MTPDELRSRIRADHREIRERLLRIESLAKRALAGGAERAAPLRLEAEQLLERLVEHMYWEDIHLAPALRGAGAWGTAQADRLAADHREQRELLGHSLERVTDHHRPAPLLAQNLLDLVALLRTDIAEEDGMLRDRRLLAAAAPAPDPELG